MKRPGTRLAHRPTGYGWLSPYSRSSSCCRWLPCSFAMSSAIPDCSRAFALPWSAHAGSIRHGFALRPFDVLATLGIGGVWLANVIGVLQRTPPFTDTTAPVQEAQQHG